MTRHNDLFAVAYFYATSAKERLIVYRARFGRKKKKKKKKTSLDKNSAAGSIGIASDHRNMLTRVCTYIT